MALSQERYDPQSFYDSVQTIKDTLTNEERIAWLKHPCTMALVRTLEGDLCAIVSTWMGGGYAAEDSTDGTAQKQAHARGMAKTIDDVIDYIEDLSKPV